MITIATSYSSQVNDDRTDGGSLQWLQRMTSYYLFGSFFSSLVIITRIRSVDRSVNLGQMCLNNLLLVVVPGVSSSSACNR